MDVYHDPEHGNGAALIDIHGAGWFSGDKSKDAVANDVPVSAHFLAGARHAKGYQDDVYAHTLTFLNQHLLAESRTSA
jgi:hypothetical protein